MYCKWCGMDSRDNKTCEWCRRPFATGGTGQPTVAVPPSAPAPPQPSAPQAPPTPRVISAETVVTPRPQVVSSPPPGTAVPPGQAAPGAAPPWQSPAATQPDVAATNQPWTPTGQVNPAAPGTQTQPDIVPPWQQAQTAASAAPGIKPDVVMPQHGPQPDIIAPTPWQTPQQSGPQPTTAIQPQPTGGSHYRPPAPSATPFDVSRDAGEEDDDIPLWYRFERYLGIMLPALALGMFVTNHWPNQWYWSYFMLLFLSTFLLGALRVVGTYDDNYSETGLLIMGMLWVGPILTSLAYGIYSGIKREPNSAVAGILATYFVVTTAILVARFSSVAGDTFGFRFAFNTCDFLAICTLLGGWMLSSFARPVGE